MLRQRGPTSLTLVPACMKLYEAEMRIICLRSFERQEEFSKWFNASRATLDHQLYAPTYRRPAYVILHDLPPPQPLTRLSPIWFFIWRIGLAPSDYNQSTRPYVKQREIIGSNLSLDNLCIIQFLVVIWMCYGKVNTLYVTNSLSVTEIHQKSTYFGSTKYETSRETC